MSGRHRGELRLGFVALTDAAPLIVAAETGQLAAEGLNVVLCREASWANIRDKVQAGLLDGAHMLGPMALATSLGAGSERTPLVAPLSLNLNGSAITVSKALAEAMRAADPSAMAERPRTARALAAVVRARQASGEPRLILAAVFPFFMHAYELRYWMAQAGIDPDRDIRLVIIPPERMAARLKSGEIDGFCVGAPWHAVSAVEGAGEIILHASEFWRSGPDKVFAVTEAFAERNPDVLRALIRALIRASAWAESPENRMALAAILAREPYVGAPEAIIRQSLPSPSRGAEEIVFHRHAAGFPWRSHALWFLTQMLRWGQIEPEVDITAAARAVYRPDLYRAAASDIGAPAPAVDEKVEGAHAETWTLETAGAPIAMGPDRFFDGRVFDPDRMSAYLRGFEIGGVRAL